MAKADKMKRDHCAGDKQATDDMDSFLKLKRDNITAEGNTYKYLGQCKKGHKSLLPGSRVKTDQVKKVYR